MLSAATLVASVAALGVGMALHRREEWREVLTAVAAAALSALSAPSAPSPTPTPTTNPSPSPSPLQSLRSLGFDPAGYAPSTASASYPPGTASAGYPLITAYGARDLPAGAALLLTLLVSGVTLLLWTGRRGAGRGAALALSGGGEGGEAGATPSLTPGHPRAGGGTPLPGPAGGGPFYASACVALLCASLVSYP